VKFLRVVFEMCEQRRRDTLTAILSTPAASELTIVACRMAVSSATLSDLEIHPSDPVIRKI